MIVSRLILFHLSNCPIRIVDCHLFANMNHRRRSIIDHCLSIAVMFTIGMLFDCSMRKFFVSKIDERTLRACERWDCAVIMC